MFVKTSKSLKNIPIWYAGTIGHVAHGKSTVVKAISGVQTVRFKNELERNITIKLGYANAKIYCAKDGKVPRPQSYKAYGSSKEDSPACDAPGYEGAEMELLRHVSFVDCPGHDILMATMLNGAAVMDGALLLIAANESCPQPQTSEHLAAVEIMRLKHIIILQNKIDLISESVAANQHEAIQTFIQGTIAEGAPVVPISAQLKYNVDAVCEYIVKKIPVPVRQAARSCSPDTCIQGHSVAVQLHLACCPSVFNCQYTAHIQLANHALVLDVLWHDITTVLQMTGYSAMWSCAYIANG